MVENKLFDHLMITSNYNRNARPVKNNSFMKPVSIELGVRLIQITDVDEKKQILTSTLRIFHRWKDPRLTWNPKEYDNIKLMHIPSRLLWVPDIGLYNNADGNYEIPLKTNTQVYYNGTIIWEPAAIYKSSCPINVEFFPFDIQECYWKFGSWSYDGSKINLIHYSHDGDNHSAVKGVIKHGIDLSNFYPNIEWEVLAVTAEKKVKYYECCIEPYIDIFFYITIRRKTVFYLVNFLFPCVCISFLTILVFYLPAGSGEKITLCISILLSLAVFILLLADIVPPTSLIIPLIGKYLLFTIILVTLSVILTVIVLNVHFRSCSTHRMPVWVKLLFLWIFPSLLGMHKLYGSFETNNTDRGFIRFIYLFQRKRKQFKKMGKRWIKNMKFYFFGKKSPKSVEPSKVSPICSNETEFSLNLEKDFVEDFNICTQQKISQMNRYSESIRKSICIENQIKVIEETEEKNKIMGSLVSQSIQSCIEAVKFIADIMREEATKSSSMADWQFVAMVLDRLFLWIFFIAILLGFYTIIITAPTLVDKRVAIA